MNLWKAFWLGGEVEGEGDDNRTPPLASLPEQPGKVLHSAIWGMSFPWTLVLCAALGAGLMFVPALFGIEGSGAHVNHVGGALILTMATLAMGEPLRIVRFVNVALGLVVAGAPWIQGLGVMESLVSTAIGIAVLVLSLPRGQIRETYGLWQRFVR